MRHNHKKIIIILCIVLLLAILRFSQNTDDFSTYNTEWNGGKLIKNELSQNHTFVSMPATNDLSKYDPEGTAFIILRPEGDISRKDIEIIRKFITDGGLLIVADDFGSGNDILNNVTTQIAFSNMLLLDDVNFWKNITFPVVSAPAINVSNITMNFPASLIIKDNSVQILASSSTFSWLSTGNITRGTGGSYPVIASTISGNGTIIAISDPSIFINSMLRINDNEQLLGKLVKNRNIIIFDEKMRMPLIWMIQYQLKNNTVVQYIFAASIILLSYIYMNRERLYSKKGTEKDALDNISSLDEKDIILDLVKRNKWDDRKIEFFKNKLEGRK